MLLKPGMKAEAKFKSSNPDAELFANVWIPIQVSHEYEKFYTVDILPHRNPIRSYGVSHPYKMTILKHEIKCGDVLVRNVYY